MPTFLRNLSTRVLSFLFPEWCVGCGQKDTWLCDTCVARAARADDNAAMRATKIRIISGIEYQSPAIKKAIHLLKYRGAKRIANTLARELYQRITEEVAEWLIIHAGNTPIVIPIPLSKKSQRIRQYNHAELISEQFANLMGASVQKDILLKIRETNRQARTKTKAERLKNVSGSMAAVNVASLCGSPVIIIDDVCTTGATIAEAARALRAGGFYGPMIAVTVAH